MKSLMLNLNSYLTEAYFISSFINGLSEELGPTVKMLQPRIIKQAAESARLQELTVEALMRKNIILYKGIELGEA